MKPLLLLLSACAACGAEPAQLPPASKYLYLDQNVMQCVVPTHNVISISNPTNLTLMISNPTNLTLMCGEHGQISIDLTTGKVTLTNVTMDESGVLFWAGVIKAFPGVREVIRAEGTK